MIPIYIQLIPTRTLVTAQLTISGIEDFRGYSTSHHENLNATLPIPVENQALIRDWGMIVGKWVFFLNLNYMDFLGDFPYLLNHHNLRWPLLEVVVAPRHKVQVSKGTAAPPPSEAIHWELPLMELPPFLLCKNPVGNGWRDGFWWSFWSFWSFPQRMGHSIFHLV